MRKKNQRKSTLTTSVLTLTALLMVFAFMPIDRAFAVTQAEDPAAADQLAAASASVSDEVFSDAGVSDNVVTEDFAEGDVTEDIGELSAAEQAEVKKVIDMIKSLPAEFTPKAAEAIAAAWAAYEDLSTEQKLKISAALLDTLKQAKAALDKYIDPAAVEKVTNLIKDLPVMIQKNGAKAVTKVRKAYNNLTPAQMALIPKSVTDILDTAERFFTYPDGQASYVSELIDKIPANPTLKDAQAVYLANVLYELMIPAQKTKVPAELKTKLSNANTTLFQWAVFEGKVKVASKLVPQDVTAKNKKSKKAVVTWKATKGDGYEVWCSTSKKFKKKGLKKKTIKKASVTKATFKSLKKGKTYYVKVRTVSQVSNAATGKVTAVTSDWSEVKKVKIKK